MQTPASSPDPRRIVPVHPADYHAVYQLRRASEPQVLAVLSELLAWTRDESWPIAGGVGEVLATHFRAIRPQALTVLRGPDADWQHSFLGLVVGRLSRKHLDKEVVAELRRLAQHPSPDEQAAGADRRARQLLDVLGR